MKKRLFIYVVILLLMLYLYISVDTVYARVLKDNRSIDEKVRAFLANHKYKWQDMNVPGSDGKVLYDLIIKNNYKNALEIGTSTGHSAIWMAWALSKTGGKLITLEIDEYRYKQALENFKKAGLSNYIETRLGDAHEMVPKLKGPFDFIFVDADKDWYSRYLKLLLPKLKKGGCFTAHNVLNVFMRGIKEFRVYLESLPTLETTIHRSSSSGVSVSYKKSD